MNRDAIRAEIRRRNDIRREAHLPLIDEEAEFAGACQTAALDELHAFLDRFADVRQRFLDEYIAEQEQKTGRPYNRNVMGMWAARAAAYKRFEAWIAEHFGVTWPPAPDQEERIASQRPSDSP